MIGERLFVLECRKPFTDFWVMQRWECAGYLSRKEMLDYVRGKLQGTDSLPMRIDILCSGDTKEAARILHNQIISVAQETKAQMEMDVRFKAATGHVGNGNATFYLRKGTITTLHSHDAVQRPDGDSEPLASGLVDPKDLEQHMLWRLTTPKCVPLMFRIECDQASTSLAKQVADQAEAIVKRLGIGELADVKTVRVEPVPETTFLGRWRGATRGDIHEVDIRPNGVCEVTMGDRFGKDKTTGAVKAGTTVRGTWLLITDEIIIDINDKSEFGNEYRYRGYVEDDGSLIVDKGKIYAQGSFHVSGAPRHMILDKVQ